MGGLNNSEICMWFDVEHNSFDRWCMNKAVKKIEAEGMKVIENGRIGIKTKIL